jgi:hypothetical protein
MKQQSLGVLWERVRGIVKALKVQVIEIRRRLNELNGEGNRIKEILKESIPREVFDRTINDLRGRIEAIEKWQVREGGFERGKDKLVNYLPWVIAAVSFIVSTVLALWSIFKK